MTYPHMQMILDAITNPPDQPDAILAAQPLTAHDPAPNHNAGSSYPAIAARQGMCSISAQIRMIWMRRSTHPG